VIRVNHYADGTDSTSIKQILHSMSVHQLTSLLQTILRTSIPHDTYTGVAQCNQGDDVCRATKRSQAARWWAEATAACYADERCSLSHLNLSTAPPIVALNLHPDVYDWDSDGYRQHQQISAALKELQQGQKKNSLPLLETYIGPDSVPSASALDFGTRTDVAVTCGSFLAACLPLVKFTALRPRLWLFLDCCARARGLDFINTANVKNATTMSPGLWYKFVEGTAASTGFIITTLLKNMLMSGLLSEVVLFGFGGIAHYYGGSDIVHCVSKGSHQFHNFALEHSLFRKWHATVEGFRIHGGLTSKNATSTKLVCK